VPPLAPYRAPSWPEKPRRSPLRRFRPVRSLPVHTSLLLTLTVYLFVAMYVGHVLTLALRMGLHLPAERSAVHRVR